MTFNQFLSMHEILEIISLQNGISISVLLGPRRLRRYSWPRQEAMWRMRQAGYKLEEIGDFLGGRDHSTISYGIWQHERRTNIGEANDRLHRAMAHQGRQSAAQSGGNEP